jgi:hypothetical protein
MRSTNYLPKCCVKNCADYSVRLIELEDTYQAYGLCKAHIQVWHNSRYRQEFDEALDKDSPWEARNRFLFWRNYCCAT